MTKPTKWVCAQRRLRSDPPSLIRVFAVRLKKPLFLSNPMSAQRSLWSDWADAQAELSLRWAHTHFVVFVMSRLIYSGFAIEYMDRVKRIWYLSPMRAAKVQASLRIRAVSPEPPLLAHTSNESRGTFRQKARSMAPLNGWACAVKLCHDGMLEDTNSLGGAHMPHCLHSKHLHEIIVVLCFNSI